MVLKYIIRLSYTYLPYLFNRSQTFVIGWIRKVFNMYTLNFISGDYKYQSVTFKNKNNNDNLRKNEFTI